VAQRISAKLVVVTIVLLAAGAGTAAVAIATPDDSLACEMIAGSTVKKALSVSHIHFSSSATSPTAPSPEDHTIDGGDQSVCEFFGYDHKPSKAELKQLRKAKQPVPSGFGSVVVTTEVRDDEPGGEGENWDPTVAALTWAKGLTIARKALGGAGFSSSSFGSFLHRSDWIGNQDRTAGFYEVGDGGDASAVIVLNVNSADPSHAPYKAIAKKVVPAFTNVFLSP
jgi:hypothetical protein